MPRITDYMLVTQPAHKALKIARKVTAATLPQAIGECFGKLAEYMAKAGGEFADVPYVAYVSDMHPDGFDIACCFPVTKALPGEGEIVLGEWPEYRVASFMFLGDYSGLEAAYGDLAQYMEKEGLKMGGPAFECYYNGPNRPAEQLLTKVAIALR